MFFISHLIGFIYKIIIKLSDELILYIRMQFTYDERVGENGFSRLQGVWMLREIVILIVMKILTALCFPYVLS